LAIAPRAWDARGRLTGRSRGGHFGDRFQAFIIIALGESIVITGATGFVCG